MSGKKLTAKDAAAAAARRKAILAFVRDKAQAYQSGASYEDTCFRAADLAAAVRVQGVEISDHVAFAALEGLEVLGWTEYHWPREAPAYWRATSKAAREIPQ